MKQKKSYYFLVIAVVIVIIFFIFKNNISIENFNNNDESECLYVSSHGIKKTCEKLKDVYYIKSDKINDFTIPDTPFILVTGDEDTTLPEDFLEKSNIILNNKNLKHWFSQNLTIESTKLSRIPIGLDYHTLSKIKSEYQSWGDIEPPKKQELYLLELQNKLLPFYEREIKLYCNFYNSIRGKYGKKDRKDALTDISKDLLIIEKENITRKDTWKDMSKYAFVLSPHGNGLDCHRTWEALVIGCIPIVKTSVLDSLYTDLPVLIVYSWNDINITLLNDTILNFKKQQFNMEKLKLQYWIDKIKSVV